MTTNQETHMTTQISTKLAALAAALMMNSLLIVGVAYVFTGPMHQQPTTVIALAHTAVSTQNGEV